MNVFDTMWKLNLYNEDLVTMVRTIAIFLIVPLLLNCFFGYKIQKFFITIGGVVIGGIAGMIIGIMGTYTSGVPAGGSAVVVLAMLGGAALGGFLAFKFYLVGLFFSFWFRGTVLFAVLFLVTGSGNMIPAAVVFGLIVGVLVLVLHKGFVICTTAICGGVPAGVGISIIIMGSLEPGLLLGVGLSVLGIFVQFCMEKKESAVSTQNVTTTTVPVAPNGFNAPAVAAEKPTSSKAPENRFQALGTTVPTTYCPCSGVLTEQYSLFKDYNENVFVTVNFRNVGRKPIIAIYYTLLCQSVGGDDLGSMERVLLDLNVAPGARISSGEPFRLTDHTTRRIDVRLTQVVTADGESIRLTEEDAKPLPKPRGLHCSLSSELLELAGIREDEHYFLTELENNLWVCACGTIASEACPHCGKTRSDVLRDNGNDIYVRINNRVKAELSRTENLTDKRELMAARDAVSRDRQLLQSCENLKKLTEDCDNVMKSIGERLSQITVREKNAKKKVCRYALLVGIVASLALVITFLRGLPPSDSRVVKDMTANFTEQYGSYQITDSEIEELNNSSEKNWKAYHIKLWGENKTLHDEFYVSTYLSYKKERGVFRLYDIDYYVPFITPAAPPAPSDTYTGLTVGIQSDGDVIVVSDYEDGWEPLSELSELAELSYSSKLDHANAEIEGNIARIPVSFQVSYRNEEGELDSTINYTYLGNRVWQANISEMRIELHIKDDVALTQEVLVDILKNETMQYEGEMLSCEYLTLRNERITYTEGGQHAEGIADFVWNDGDSSFGGTLTIELDYTDGCWYVTSVSCMETSHPTANAAITKDQAAILLRSAIEEEGTVVGEFVELSVDDIHESDGFADLTSHYVAREGEYLRSILIKGRYEYHAGQGYQLAEKLSYGEATLRPERDISASLSTNYRLKTQGATPVGIASSGVAQVTVNINTSGAANFTLNIDDLLVNLTGSLSASQPIFSCSSAEQEILVRYKFILTMEGEIRYSASGNLRYENDTLRGTLVFDTVALGVDSFSVTLGD